MSSEILNAMAISASGMQAQGTRLRVISENIANASTTANAPGEDPYIRQTIIFENELDRALDVNRVQVKDIENDRETPFTEKYMPDHPGADERGYVKFPNVNVVIEMMDSREAQRSYEANLGMIDQSRDMVTRTIDLLR